MYKKILTTLILSLGYTALFRSYRMQKQKYAALLADAQKLARDNVDLIRQLDVGDKMVVELNSKLVGTIRMVGHLTDLARDHGAEI